MHLTVVRSQHQHHVGYRRMTFQKERKYIHAASAGTSFIGEYGGPSAKPLLRSPKTVWPEPLIENSRPSGVIIKTAFVSGIQAVGVGIPEA